jgi:hypothetical protein
VCRRERERDREQREPARGMHRSPHVGHPASNMQCSVSCEVLASSL